MSSATWPQKKTQPDPQKMAECKKTNLSIVCRNQAKKISSKINNNNNYDNYLFLCAKQNASQDRRCWSSPILVALSGLIRRASVRSCVRGIGPAIGRCVVPCSGQTVKGLEDCTFGTVLSVVSMFFKISKDSIEVRSKCFYSSHWCLRSCIRS